MQYPVYIVAAFVNSRFQATHGRTGAENYK